jgi:hypothetical protein
MFMIAIQEQHLIIAVLLLEVGDIGDKPNMIH